MRAEPSGAVLTVRETLAMPAFAQARVVAGQAGLERPVRRVHIVDLPGAAYEWGTRDVLLLTAGVGLAEDLDRQAALVPDLVGRGVAGMVLSVGHILDDAPDVMRAAADELGFPLVTTPPGVRFIELTEAIWQELVNRRDAAMLTGDFLEQVLTSTSDAVALTERAHQLRFRLDRGHAVICLRTDDGTAGPLEQAVTRWLRSVDRWAISVWRGDVLVVVLESADDDQALLDAAALTDAVDAATMANALDDATGRLVAGVGNVEPPDRVDVRDRIRHSYEQAREALLIAGALPTSERVVAFRDLGLLHWLWHVPPEARAGNRYVERVQALAAYDREHRTDLLVSLEAYLDHGGSLAETAAGLYVHRNTLLARIHRVAEVLAVDLAAPSERLNLAVALKAYRLHGR
jgi:DNA-binding PucR family transcriptional regulator